MSSLALLQSNSQDRYPDLKVLLYLSNLDLWRDGPPHETFKRLRAEEPLHWSELGDFEWEYSTGPGVVHRAEHDKQVAALGQGACRLIDLFINLAEPVRLDTAVQGKKVRCPCSNSTTPWSTWTRWEPAIPAVSTGTAPS